jgi:hypothetical protein
MKHLPILLPCLFLCLHLQPAYADDEEDFEPQEDGQMFDTARTGLLYKRALYQSGEDSTAGYNITYVPYYPTQYAGTVDISPGGTYISHWEQDPPSFVIVYINNDTARLITKIDLDFTISIGQADRLGNYVTANRKLITGVSLDKGINRIPVAIHNYKGDIVSVKLAAQRPTFAILPIEGNGQ